MQPLPFDNGVASALFAVGIVAIVGVQLRIAVLSNVTILRSRGHTQRHDRLSLPLVGVTSGGGVVAGVESAVHLTGATIAPGVAVVRWLVFLTGVAAMVAGAVIRQWAISTLGRFFTFDVRISEGQSVVDGGPYRWVRHPSYTGLLLSLLGLGFTFGNWLSILALALLPPAGLAWRIRVEEQALRSELGEPYLRFAATRKRLVPGVW